MAHCAMPAVLDMIESGKERFPDDEEKVVGMCAGLYTSGQNIVALLTPLFGSAVAEVLGFRLTMDILAFFDLAFFIAYFCLGGGMKTVSRSFKAYKIRSEI